MLLLDPARIDLLKSVEQFLYHEARLMDEHRFDEWLALWADECLYYAPVNDEDIDPSRHATLFHEARPQLEDRISQLKSSVHWSQLPKSRLRRVVSNVEVEEATDQAVAVASNFVLVEVRRERQTVFAGRSIHRLLPVDGGFKIAYKKVLLTNLDATMGNLRILL